MKPRNLALLALVCMLSPRAYADQHHSDSCSGPIEYGTAVEGGVCIPPLPAQLPEFAEIPAARGKAQHAVIIRQIAIYASVGNRAAVEILTAQLSALDMSRETIMEGVIWERVHGSSQDHQHDGASSATLPQSEAEWEMSQ